MSEQKITTNQAREPFWISISVAVIMSVAWLGAVRNLLTMDGLADWQRALPLIAMGATVIAALVSIWLCRRGRSSLGISLILIGLMASTMSIPFVVAGRATLFALVVMLLIIAIATQGLPEKKANTFIIIGSLFMIFTVLLDWWGPVERSTPTVSPTPIIAMGIGAIILMIVVGIRYRFLKLRSKLLVVLMAIPVVIVAAVGIFFVSQITTQLNADIVIHNLFDGDGKVGEIQSFLGTTESDIQFLGQSLVVQTYLEAVDDGDPELIEEALFHLNEELRIIAQTRQIYDQVRFIDASGQEIARVDRGADGVISVAEAVDLQNKSGRYYFDDTIQLSSGELMISPLDLNVEHGAIEIPYKPMLRYGTPVEFNGETRGVFVTNVLAQNFLDILGEGEVTTYLVDEDGYYLYHPDEDKRWGRDLEMEITIVDDFPGLRDLLLAGKTGSLKTDLDLLTYQPVMIPSETSPRWYLANSISNTAVLAPVNAALAPGLAILAIALLLIPSLAIFFSQTIANPIILLTTSAEEIAAGNLDVTLDVESEDEIGALAQAFNEMAARLRTLVGSLELQVSQRTHGLELAAEIGSRLTQITDRRELLDTAVNLIGERFHLYYTQIYRVDALGKTLRIQAGTGLVGEELMRRAHYLPVGKGSINGVAAAEQTAVVVEDVRDDLMFRSNELLPYTRSEMVVPLMVGGQLIGTLNMQADQVGILTKSDLITFDVLASQLAIAWQNAELFGEREEAQSSIEAQSRLLTHENWDAYLDAVDRREHIAYRYDQIETKLLDEELTTLAAGENGMETAVLVNKEEVGSLQIVGLQDRVWTDGEQELLDLVAQQVGQRIENLRLLDETDRYRNEAERALRRMTREGWDSYQQQSEQALAHGYQYDGNEVTPFIEENVEEADSLESLKTAVSQSLVIGGQKIGSLSVGAENGIDGGTAVLLEQVAAQLSSHIEALRLENQTENALSMAQRRGHEMEQLNEIVAKISKTLDLQESLRIVAEELVSVLNIAQSSITLLDEARENLIITASYPAGADLEGLVIPIEGNLLTQRVLDTRQYAFVADAQSSPLTAVTHGIFRKENIQAVAVFPMIIGGELIGTVGLDIKTANTQFTEDQLRLAETIIAQAATTVQNARLFEQTEEALAEAKRRSEEMATVNRVAQIASQQVDVEPLLQAIYTEMKTLMDVGTFHIMLYNAETELMEYPLIYEQDVRTHQEPLPLHPDSYSYRVLQNGEPILNNLTAEEVVEDRKRGELFIGTNDNRETVSVMYAPLHTGQEVTGTLSIQSYNYDEYDETDLSLLVSIANYVAVALESARLFEQTRARARQERLLREVSERVHTAVDAETVLQTAAREINRLLGVDVYAYLENTAETASTSNGGQS